MSPTIYVRDNGGSLATNPPAGDQHLSTNVSDWLWAVAAVYIFSWIAMALMVWKARAGERVFHYLFIAALAVGSIVYYAEASDLGWKVIPQTNYASDGSRQIFWAKYILWVVEFPVAIIALGLLSGISWATIVYNIFISWVWVISYLVGAFTISNYKWGFFAFGTFAWMILALHTLRDGTVGSKRLGVTRDYSALSGWVNLLWLLYPIAWGVGDGGNVIGVAEVQIWYGVLDILFTPVTAWAFVLLARRWDYNRLNIHFTQYGRVNHHPGTFPEKNTTAAPAAPPAAVPA